MSRIDTIRTLLQKQLSPVQLEITDESAKHSGHAGAGDAVETHFNLYIVSDHFKGVNRVQRHRMINEVLATLYKQGLHALAITAKSGDES